MYNLGSERYNGRSCIFFRLISLKSLEDEDDSVVFGIQDLIGVRAGSLDISLAPLSRKEKGPTSVSIKDLAWEINWSKFSDLVP